MPDLQVELPDDVVVAEVFLDVFKDDVGRSKQWLVAGGWWLVAGGWWLMADG